LSRRFYYTKLFDFILNNSLENIRNMLQSQKPDNYLSIEII